MKEYLKSLEKQACKKLNKEETKELVNFYEEVINDRLSNGEELDIIIKDYEVNRVVKEALVDSIMKRDRGNSKLVWQITLVLFSTPILIPLAIVYLSLFIVTISIFISGILTALSGIIAIIPYIINIFIYTKSFGVFLGLFSIGVIGVLFIFLVGYFLTIASYYATKGLGIFGLKIIGKGKN